ncbi:MAG TPA: 2-phospho-L-lactate guanylyltransferase [Terriglobales bacterium]|nr:2-phospho-L-lactate guanylyltransferase [Terriglobales bacterium]
MILVPVKNLGNAKQRLAAVLDPGERFALAEAMLHDVLGTLARCSRRDEVGLVTGDRRALQMAADLRFHVIEDAVNHGESEAIEMATRVCVKRGATYTLVLPGDIPLTTVHEVEAIFTAAANDSGAVLVPSASGRGSNAVLRRPADLFPLRFGNDSFQPHLAAARATGHPFTVLPLPGIGLDVDDPADLIALLMAEGETRAQRLLRQWNVARRLLAAAHG